MDYRNIVDSETGTIGLTKEAEGFIKRAYMQGRVGVNQQIVWKCDGQEESVQTVESMVEYANVVRGIVIYVDEFEVKQITRLSKGIKPGKYVYLVI